MHASLLIILLATGVAQTCCDQGPPVAAVEGSGTAVSDNSNCTHEPYNPRRGFWQSCLSLWLGPMPQTCYAPRFGPYPGNDRHMQRYPAFHGTYYRQPYNYRQLFDYPWQAAPYDPQDYFTHQEGGY